MKTAMQELIDEILSKQEIWFDEDGNILEEPIIQYVNSFKSSVDLSEYVNKAVEKEKEQIINTYEIGSSHGMGVIEDGLDYIHGIEYFDQTYNQ
jgi:chromosome condensin MukBEF ATPase and DNA-binding subunit MukB